MQSDATFLLIMPSYNQAHYIASAVESVLTQDDPNWVLWIVDNSSDTTPEVMKGFTDQRIHFVHIPQRMDPGACLNWVLEKEGHRHRDFSYIHTDNLLRSDYVRLMREALAVADDCIAYCDMRSLDAQGRLTGVFRRGTFDLARLFSFSTLGVPFSATTKLSQTLGGFNRMDVADDVIFCVRAWPIARFVHIADAIMDYRLHGNSRTTEHGGAWEIERSFLKAYSRLLPEMVSQGVDPIGALAERLRQLQTDMQPQVEDAWYRGRHISAMLPVKPSVQTLHGLNMLDLCGIQADQPDAKTETGLARLKGKIRKRVLRWQNKRAATALDTLLREKINRHLVWELSTQFRHHAIPWVYLSVTRKAPHQGPIRLASTDIHTLWITLLVHRMCGWRFQIEHSEQLELSKWPQLDVIDAKSPPPTLTMSLAQGELWVRPFCPD